MRDEIAHRLGIGDVAALSGVAHDQMVFHQPGDRAGIFRRQTEPRTQAFGDGRADVGMIARQALGDVVQQHRAIKHLARLDALDQIAGEGMLVLEFAAFDRRHISHGADQVLVDRVMVVHVELHQGDDAAELRHEFPEDARLVHQPERPLRIAARG